MRLHILDEAKFTFALIAFCIITIFFSCKKEVDRLEYFIEPPVPVDTSYSQTFISAAVKIFVNENSDSMYTKRAYNGVPAIEVDGKGNLFIAWYCRKNIEGSFLNNGEGPNNYIAVAFSKDAGETWVNNGLVVSPLDTLDRVFDPMLWRDNKGKVHLFWTFSKGKWWDGKGGVWDSEITLIGGNIHFTDPKLCIFNGIMINKPLSIDSNKAFYPSYIPNWGYSPDAGIYIYERHQSATTPNDAKLVSKLKLPKTIEHPFYEPSIVLEKDSLACFVRTATGIWFIKCKNDGQFKWGEFRKLESIGENAPTRFFISRLNSGRTLLSTNSSTQRTNLSIFLGDSSSTNFESKTVIDTRLDVSYPDITEYKGMIYMTYDRSRKIDKEINFAKFKETDFLSNGVKLNGMILKKVNVY